MRLSPVICIEGLIGSGKSTLTEQLSRDLGLRPVFEPVDSNPYLSKFYQDPKRWAFPMQMHLMHLRFAMQKIAAYEAALGHGSILDRGMPGDRLFCQLHVAEGNIDPLEWGTYEQAYQVMSSSFIPPSVIIYLDVEPEVALDRIRVRSRDAEVPITLDYLRKLKNAYRELVRDLLAGRHPWSRGTSVWTVDWNQDFRSIQPLVDNLRDHFRE